MFFFRLLQHPSDYIQPLEEALADIIDKRNWDPKTDGKHIQAVQDAGGSWHIGFEGPFGCYHVTPRNLLSNLLGSMVKVEGIVTKCERQMVAIKVMVAFAVPLCRHLACF